MRLLVSACNTGSPLTALFVLDTDTEDIVYKPVPQSCLGTSGIIKTATGYMVVMQSEDKTGVLTLDQSLNTVKSYWLCQTLDGHGICHDGVFYYLASPGNNSIVKFHIDQNQTLREETHLSLSWEGFDKFHLNDVTYSEGDWFISGFGDRRLDQMWSEIHNGFILRLSYDINQNQPLRVFPSYSLCVGDLDQPHSVNFIDGELSYCVSRAGEFFVGDRMVTLSGYLRGVSWTDNRIFVGSSGSRNISRSTGALMSYESSRASIFELDKNLKVIRQIHLPEVKEVFELEVI